jgi:hypothetical protein
VITPAEYQQLKAFARIDGALLSLLWISSFALYIKGMENATMGMLSLILLIIAPFYVGKRLRKFRDYARQGIISFRRGYAYIVFVFFYSGLLFAIAQYVYFTYMDHGFLLAKFTEIANAPETIKLGINDMMTQSLNEMASMRPIDFALNVLTVVIMTGFALGLPIAALLQRKDIPLNNSNSSTDK